MSAMARMIALVVCVTATRGAAAPVAAPPPAPAAGPAVPPAVSPAPPVAVEALRVDIETIAVDRRGTWSVGSDQADLFPGRTGVLRKEATLMSRVDEASREIVDLTVRVTPDRAPGAACVLKLRTEARRAATGPGAGLKGPNAPDRKTIPVTIQPGEEKLVEVYSSVATNGRLALKVRCADSPPPPAIQATFIDFNLTVSRADDDGDLRPLKDNLLKAALGAESSNSFSVNIPLAEDQIAGKRYRRESLEVVLTPQIISGDSLQLSVRILGELATISSFAAAVIHPISHAETVVMKAGESRTIVVEIPSRDEAEGWRRVRYRVDVFSRF